ncbi:right-handed parallel beta-helix repeat-containing protein [Candidatus Peregrinibacteria bacterium]|nr:right-handed parallel beta-helix repeat-containing protein [Candidatus Peregrinibacteria bacterium]
MFRRALVVILALCASIGVGVYFALLALGDRDAEIPSETANFGVFANSTRGGVINADETWEDTITVTEPVIVEAGVTLTIRPNTTVKFKNNRNYKNPQKLSIDVRGTLKAIGTKDALITFTSDAYRPRNGDWGAVKLIGKQQSEIRYAIVEFGMDGVMLEQSDATISHAIVRWHNHDGITAFNSTPVIEATRIYENGENGVSVLQSNGGILRSNLIEKNGSAGVHLDSSQWSVENSVIKDNHIAALWIENGSALTALHNSIGNSGVTEILCGRGTNTIDAFENTIVSKSKEIECPEQAIVRMVGGAGVQENKFEVLDTRKFYLLYTPGDLVRDRYQYAYPAKDDTRKIVRKIGKNLGPVRGMAVDGTDVWTLSAKGMIYKLDGDTGEPIQQWRASSRNPVALAFDGTRLWVTDLDEKRTYALDPKTGIELASFNNPDPQHGATGLASDGTMLYLREADTNKVYTLEDTGALGKTIELSVATSGGIAFDGKYFWAPCRGGICRFGNDGSLLGKIYAPSEGMHDMEWAPATNRYGGYLWVAGKTHDRWNDEKLFKIEVISDSLVRRPSYVFP